MEKVWHKLLKFIYESDRLVNTKEITDGTGLRAKNIFMAGKIVTGLGLVTKVRIGGNGKQGRPYVGWKIREDSKNHARKVLERIYSSNHGEENVS